MQYISTEEIRRSAENPQAFIRSCEAEYDAMIADAANTILSTLDERPIVLLSGPSGSGKTTTAVRIEELLDSMGHETYTLSMDNYFFRRADGVMPLDDEGNPDLESPLCIDMPLLQQHLEMLIDCKQVYVPSFDFINQCRAEKVTPLRRNPGEIIVVEGIHALNPEVVGDAMERSTGVYVSVRTRVRDSNGYVLHPAKIRLLRRLMRDRRGRGQSYEDTIRRLRSVNRGERLYIMPHKHHAQIALDTFCPYELPVYRDILLPGLTELNPEMLEDCDVSDIIPMLRQLTGMTEDGIEKTAMIREFIGGGLVV